MEKIVKKLESIHKKAKIGSHVACIDCPRNPKKHKTSYAKSCMKHFGVKKHGLIIIMRDPGKEGASKTAKLCPFENDDRTAKRFRKFLEKITIPKTDIYLCNAVLHGYDNENREVKVLERKCCRKIVEEIIELLQPNIILTFGLEAIQSAFEILTNKDKDREKLKLEDLISRNFDFGKLENTYLFGLPHPARGASNLAKHSKHWCNEENVWKEISGKINKILRSKKRLES
jgi:uracil-DNA glycosylase family 4